MSVKYPIGRYRLRILSAALGESGTGNPQIEIVVGPTGEDGEAGSPRRVYLTLTDATLGTPQNPGWVWETLAFLGFTGPSFADLDPLVGRECEGQCKHEPDDKGEMREKWSIFRGSSGPKTALPPQGLKRLDSKFAGLLRGAGGPQPARPAQPVPARPPASDDDIPF